MKKKHTKIALLGCSRISKQHIAAFEALKDRCSLVDICDINEESLHKTSLITKANAYSDYQDMLNSSEAECVVITTPNGLHHDHTIKAAEKGFHVITEKPMAVNLKDAEEMVDVCEHNAVKLLVVKQVRFAESIQMIKKALDENRFGQIFMINMNIFWTRPQEFYDEVEWRGSIEMDGGTLMNQASHYIDIIDWLFGPTIEVSAMNETLKRNIETEDSSVINLKMKSGTLGSLAITVLTFPSNLECSLTIIGEKGTVKLGGPSLNKFIKWEFSKMTAKDEKIESTEAFKRGFSHLPYYEHIFDVLQHDIKAETDGLEGIKSLRIISSAIESSKTKKTIKIL